MPSPGFTASLLKDPAFVAAALAKAPVEELQRRWPGYDTLDAYRRTAQRVRAKSRGEGGARKPAPAADPTKSPPSEKHEQTANSWQIELPRTRIHTLD
jgi:hypothetical protein